MKKAHLSFPLSHAPRGLMFWFTVLARCLKWLHSVAFSMNTTSKTKSFWNHPNVPTVIMELFLQSYLKTEVIFDSDIKKKKKKKLAQGFWVVNCVTHLLPQAGKRNMLPLHSKPRHDPSYHIWMELKSICVLSVHIHIQCIVPIWVLTSLQDQSDPKWMI